MAGYRKPRIVRPKEKDVPKGYDSKWEHKLHTTVLKDWEHHNEKIDYVFSIARNKAWASIMRDPKINDLVIKQRKKKISRNKKSIQSRGELTPILRIYK